MGVNVNLKQMHAHIIIPNRLCVFFSLLTYGKHFSRPAPINCCMAIMAGIKRRTHTHTHIWSEQSYGITQNKDKCWSMTYILLYRMYSTCCTCTAEPLFSGFWIYYSSLFYVIYHLCFPPSQNWKSRPNHQKLHTKPQIFSAYEHYKN